MVFFLSFGFEFIVSKFERFAEPVDAVFEIQRIGAADRIFRDVVQNGCCIRKP